MVRHGPPYDAVPGSIAARPHHHHHQARQQQAARHHTPATQYIPGHAIRGSARSAGAINAFSSDWYPGLDVYQPIESTSVAPVRQQAPNARTVVGQDAGVAVVDAAPHLRRGHDPVVTVSRRLEVPFNGQGNKLVELPAQYPPSPPPSPKLQEARQKAPKTSQSGQPDFQEEFRHLKSLVTSGSHPSPPTKQPVQEDDIAYLSRHIHRGTTPAYISSAVSGPAFPAPPTPPLTPSCKRDADSPSSATLTPETLPASQRDEEMVVITITPATPSPSSRSAVLPAYQHSATSKMRSEAQNKQSKARKYSPSELAILYAFCPPGEGSSLLVRGKKQQYRERKDLECLRLRGDRLVQRRDSHDDEKGKVLRVVNPDEPGRGS